MAGSQVPPFWHRQLWLQLLPKVPAGQAGEGEGDGDEAQPGHSLAGLHPLCPPEQGTELPLTLVAEQAGPAGRAVAAAALGVAGGSVLAVVTGQAAVGAKRVLQADCNERHCG